MRQAAVSNEPQVYQVWLNVTAATTGVGYLVQVFPERILLNGNANNAIQWQMLNGSLAFLQGTGDIDFGQNAEMFSMSFDPDQKIITARITRT
ncbi:MAG TPA: hypothetical protein VHL59_13220, partial [Thermoanaerobaculia bacterium]|nr:hypothetical protein [Thermoanaerobaculia bacterium]